MARRLRPEDLAVTAAEREAARTAATAGPAATGVGSAVGTGIGGALGALGWLVPGLGAITMPLGASVGGALGGAIGGGIGNAQAEQAEGVLSAVNEKRTKARTAEELRERALQAYLRGEDP